jgi:hypothetical protein
MSQILWGNVLLGSNTHRASTNRYQGQASKEEFEDRSFIVEGFISTDFDMFVWVG